MRFFEHQRQARAQSRRLSFLFAAVILLQLLLVNAALLLPFLFVAWLLNIPFSQWDRLTPQYFFAVKHCHSDIIVDYYKNSNKLWHSLFEIIKIK